MKDKSFLPGFLKEHECPECQKVNFLLIFFIFLKKSINKDS